MIDWDAKYEQEAREADASGQCLLDDKTALVTPAYFQRLLEYSTSNPTGVYYGKRWKARKTVRMPAYVLDDVAHPSRLTLDDKSWALCSYERIPGDDKYVRTVVRELLVVS